MPLTLPKAPPQWDQSWQTRLHQALEVEDTRNRKIGADVAINPGGKLILYSPDGHRWNVTVSNGGVVSAVALP